MKKLVFMLIPVLLIATVFCAPAFAEEFYADSNGLYTVELTLEPNNDYTVVAMKGLYDQTNYLEAYRNCTDEDLIYFDQETSDENGKVVFGPFAPMGYYDATLLLGGTNIAEPVVAGYLSAVGIKNDATITIGGLQPSYKVNGVLGTDIEIELFANSFDSFGYPTVTPVEIEFSVEGSDYISFDSESSTVTVDKFAQNGTFTVTASSENASDSVVVSIQREEAKANVIKFYSDDTYTEEITNLTVVGVGGVFPTTQVYAKLYDQFGVEFDDTLTYNFDYTATVTVPEFKPTKTGDSVLIVSSSNYGITQILPVKVTNRPAYDGAALDLYNLIKQCEADIKNIGKTVFISAESGNDIYPEYQWITSSVESTFKAAVTAANTTLSQYDEATTQDSVITSALTRLQNARATFNNAFKAGSRVDITGISITKQDIRLGIDGSNKETIDLSRYLVIDNPNHTDKLTWSTSNDEFVKVTDKGFVSTGKNGTAIISVTTRTGLTATTKVTTYTKINRIDMSPTTITATYGGEPVYFNVTAYPVTQTDILIWESSDPEVAVIETSSDGLKGRVVPLKNGTVTVTVTAASSVGTSKVIQKSRTATVVMPDWDTVSSPVASVDEGVITTGTKVTLSTETEDARIYYTLDGTTPDPDKNIGRLYVAPIAINQSLTLKAIAVKDGMYNSAVCQYSYTAVNPLIIVSDALTSPGTTADVDIKLNDVEELKKFRFKAYYEPANLKVSGYIVNESIEEYVECNINNTNGEFTFEFESENAVEWDENEVLVTLKFLSYSYADERVYTVGLGDVSMTDSQGNSVPVGMHEGKIDVKTFTLGDSDGNGRFTVADVVIIKQYLLGNQNAIDNIDLRSADFNGDGEITREDAILLSKYFAGGLNK